MMNLRCKNTVVSDRNTSVKINRGSTVADPSPYLKKIPLKCIDITKVLKLLVHKKHVFF